MLPSLSQNNSKTYTYICDLRNSFYITFHKNVVSNGLYVKEVDISIRSFHISSKIFSFLKGICAPYFLIRGSDGFAITATELLSSTFPILKTIYFFPKKPYP